MRAPPLPALLLPAAFYAVFALTGCSADKPNPTPANFGALGSGGSGDPSATRLSGEDSTLFGVGKGASKDQGQSSAGIRRQRIPVAWGARHHRLHAPGVS